MIFSQKMGQNLYCSIVSAKIWWRHSDVVFVFVTNFFANSPWYYLTSCQNLLRLNVFFMVREIGQLLLNGGGGGGLPPPAPSLCLILESGRQVRSEIFFHGQMSKDEPTGKNLVCNKSSSHFWEKLEKPVGGGGGGFGILHPPWPSEG